MEINMKTKNEILKILKRLKEKIKRKYKLKEIGVFGSYIKEEQKETSDIDILVDFKEGADLFDLIGLALFLEGKLNKKIDIVPKKALRKEIRETVLKEVAYL